MGSNIRPEANIPAALEKLMRAVRVTATSTFYRTAALQRSGTGEEGRTTDPEFLNGVWKIETDLDARALKFTVLRRIEDELGRTRTADKYAPRTVDLDLLVYGDTAIDEAGLRVPDPDIRSRSFLALPLLELCPDLALADTGERLAALPVAAAGTQLAPDRALTDWLTERIKR
ncbi:MAG: 2-amino-4-hydroxy-6-hydroxymethyldihydropteridine diphosphokinase [Planctomycetota bacterium]|nr:2-amino-4-hydroxy-6-hydroxymethyldihydropteridine diphosphokinase [Planctomycetota bacterium]